MQKQKQAEEQLTNKLAEAIKEGQELKKNLGASHDECKQLTQKHQALLDWKNEKDTLINNAEAMQKELTDKIGALDKSLTSQNEANEELKVKG